MVAVDDLEGVELAGGAVEDLIDGAIVATTDSIEAVEVGEVKGGGGADGG